MHEDLKKEKEIQDSINDVLQTYGKLEPKLEHLEVTPLPDREPLIQIVEDILEVIYPGYFGSKQVKKNNIEDRIGDIICSIHSRLNEQIYRSVRPACEQQEEICKHCCQIAEKHSKNLLRGLPNLRRQLSEDVQAAYDGDPAAKNTDEIIFAYPAIYSISVYRIAHQLHLQGIPLLPRIITEHAHSKTGIDIHPGARIGKAFFIDHGTGVVIGETTIIGDRVKLYQGVTIGALSFPKNEEGELVRGKKRHPTIGDDVVIYSGATILGGDTVIGEGSIIGGNVWLTRSVPPRTRVMIAAPELLIDPK